MPRFKPGFQRKRLRRPSEECRRWPQSVFGFHRSERAAPESLHRGQSTTDGFRHCHPAKHRGKVHVEVFVSLLLGHGPVVVLARGLKCPESRDKGGVSKLCLRKESPQMQGQDTIALARRSHINVFMGRLTTKDSVLLPRGARQVSRHTESIECLCRRRRSCWVVTTRIVDSSRKHQREAPVT